MAGDDIREAYGSEPSFSCPYFERNVSVESAINAAKDKHLMWNEFREARKNG